MSFALGKEWAAFVRVSNNRVKFVFLKKNQHGDDNFELESQTSTES